MGRRDKFLATDYHELKIEDAPQEFKSLVTELGTIRTSTDLLADEARDPESTLASGGEAKVRLVSELLGRIRGTLEALQKHTKKYKKLESSPAGLKGFVKPHKNYHTLSAYSSSISSCIPNLRAIRDIVHQIVRELYLKYYRYPIPMEH